MQIQSRPASSQVPKLNHLGFLDGIRGGAALWVLLAHCSIWGSYRTLFPDPKIAVDIFIIVSGFLMLYLAQERASAEPSDRLSTALKFYIRRFFRIAPLYYTVLGIAFLLMHRYVSGQSLLQTINPARWTGTQYVMEPSEFLSAHHTWKNFLMHISFLFGLFPSFTRATCLPDWSIGLEMQFYAVFPIWFYLVCRLQPILGSLVIFSLGILLEKILLHVAGPLNYPEPAFLLLKFPLFLAGILTASACLEVNRSSPQTAIRIVAAVLLVRLFNQPLSPFSLLLPPVMFILGSGTHEKAEPLLAFMRRILTRILSNPFTKFLADMSYGVYLTHGFFIAIFGGWLYSIPSVQKMPDLVRVGLLTLGTLAGSYSTALILHNLIEKPGIEMGRKAVGLLRKLKPPTSTAGS